MDKFKLKSSFNATFEQEKVVEKLTEALLSGKKYQVLLGVTGSGKTFSIANVINKLQWPTLIISHNKTLAAQLYQEFRSFFPENAISYFVSYYDFYQPEAYIPSTDTYIEKDAEINELIDKLRLAATTNLLTRRDTIVVSSVSCIYNIGSPKEFGNYTLRVRPGLSINREDIIERIISLQYDRGDFGFHRGTFRVRGESIEVYPAYEDIGVTIELKDRHVSNLSSFNPINGETVTKKLSNFILFPTKHFMTNPANNQEVFIKIREDLERQVNLFRKLGKELEAHRLEERVNYDLEMIQEVGYVKGIENYSRYFDGRAPGDSPNSLLEYFQERFGDQWLVVVDESHMTFPQIRGMYRGDLSRKDILVKYGFRLPAAYDNRPLTFDEFMRKIPNFIATSATAASWEISMSEGYVVEQLIRPTGIAEPKVFIRPVTHQIKDVTAEIIKVKDKGGRSLITTLTKRAAEDLSEYLSKQGINVHYIHSDIKTLERSDILDSLRKGEYDCIVGINLLREGLDLPEVRLVAVLDADKEGFLRSETALIQTMGRAARHIDGKVILYADKITNSIARSLKVVKRRRRFQLSWNKKYNIKPVSIAKPFREKVIESENLSDPLMQQTSVYKSLPNLDFGSLMPIDRKNLSKKLEKEMRLAAADLNFELAIEIRAKIRELV